MSSARPGLWRAFRIPLVLGIASLLGLVSALVGDGPFDMVSWITLGGLLIVAFIGLRRRPL